MNATLHSARFLALWMALVLILIAPAVPAGALTLSSGDPLLYVDLDRADFEFSYVPPANSDYALVLFSRDGGEVQARGEILEDGEVIASGEGRGQLCSAWLVAGRSYTLRIHGSGNAIVEMARLALSRCYDKPLMVQENQSTEKRIARAYDAHWYAFDAQQNGRILLSCRPLEPGLKLNAMLFDSKGCLLSRFENLPEGTCMLLADTRAGSRYFVRVYAPGGQEGGYALNLNRSQEGNITQALKFDAGEYRVASGSTLNLKAKIAGEALLWTSTDPQVAAVNADGVVMGMHPGEANITAYGVSSQAVCRVVVDYVPLEGVNIVSSQMRLSVGDSVDVQVEFTPENASDRRLEFTLDDPEIAEISPEGVLTGLSAGETILRVAAGDGLSDSVAITVSPAPPRYRALLVGEQSYPFRENENRNGSENSVQAIAGLLGSARFEDAAYSVRTATDLSRAELIAEIRNSFKGATEQDVSLFYITCHGSYTGGMSFLELSDGSSLSARDLERELRKIPGTVVVLIDCCGSGGAIGAASDELSFAKGITGAFSGAAIRGSKYKVLASAALDQDSFRLALNDEAEQGVMATVFARALCDGAGWDMDRNARGTMGADADFDGQVTLDELYNYMSVRVKWYLDIASQLTGEDYRQSVQIYPEGDPFVLYRRRIR